MRKTIDIPGEIYSDLEREQQDEIVGFVKENKLSGQEFHDAYLIALGLPPDTDAKEQKREEVFTLAKMLDDFMSKGFSANKIVSLLNLKKDFDKSDEIFFNMVDSEMEISDREKGALKSIVENKRQGSLTIEDIEAGKLYELKLSPSNTKEEYTENYIAAVLIRHLNEFKGKKIRIFFIESFVLSQSLLGIVTNVCCHSPLGETVARRSKELIINSKF